MKMMPQGLSVRDSLCSKGSVSDATRLLDMGGLAVDRVQLSSFSGRVVHVVNADETASACPSCGVLSVSVKVMSAPGRVTSPTGQKCCG